MRIGELAAASGVSAKTIRNCEDIGVLNPPARTPSGYRDYSPEAADRLAFIRSAQAVGLSLGEIRGIVALRDRGATPCGLVLDLITARAADLDRPLPAGDAGGASAEARRQHGRVAAGRRR